jgi:lipopolysaccharide export system protein LptA
MPRIHDLLLIATLPALLLAAPPAAAEKSDRTKPMVVEADRKGALDLRSQSLVLTGNVSVSQGTLSIRAERMELNETPNGYRSATAIGTAARQASYRQKRDAPDEWVEGSADRIEYDARTDSLRFAGNASLRLLRGAQPTNEVNGATITWDNTSEVFSVVGGNATPANPGGRVRLILTPTPAAARASSPAPDAGAAVPLKPSRTLGNPQ